MTEMLPSAPWLFSGQARFDAVSEVSSLPGHHVINIGYLYLANQMRRGCG